VESERAELAETLRDMGEQLGQTLVYNKMISEELSKEVDEIRQGKNALIARMAELEHIADVAEAHVALLKDELMEIENKNLEMKQFFMGEFVKVQQEIVAVKAHAETAIDDAQQV
jgi:hypothetical protein